MRLENTEVLTTEPRWFERGVKEAIYYRALNPASTEMREVQFTTGMGQHHQEESEG